MSVKVMAQVWELDLKQSPKFVLLAFADFADDEGFCFPSIDRLGWKTGFKRRAMYQIISDLKDAQLLIVVDQGGGRGRSTRYRVTPENGAKLAPFLPLDSAAKGADSAPKPAAETVHEDAQRVHSARQTVHEDAPQSSEEPSSKPPPPAGDDSLMLPEERLARRWAELRGIPPTRSVLRKWIPQCREFVTTSGEIPSDEFLVEAVRRGIREPAGWAWAAGNDSKPPEAKSNASAPKVDPEDCAHLAWSDFGDVRICAACGLEEQRAFA